jgi:DNA polymerase III subunit gamma/tau
MSQYQSIYRKWRPRFFEDIIGQDHITRTLMNAIKLNRIAHAYIFSGPRGVGKTTTARILAKALNCVEGPTVHPCNKCNQCLRINSGQSMDVVEIDGASNRGIDEIRELRSKIGFAPSEGKYKIYIIDEVHMLTNEAFNALLKTLEEPPSQVLFIFATTAPQKVPNTILSRCQCFNFRRISVEEIVTKLQKIIKEEQIDIDTLSLRLIAESATGSMRDAESILDQVISFGGKKITYEDVTDVLGVIPQKLFYQLTSAIADRNTKAGLLLIDKLVKEGVDLHQFVQDMIVYVHRLSLMKIFGNKNDFSNYLTIEKNPEEVNELAVTIDINIIMEIIEELNKIEDKIKYHHYPWVLLELFIVKMTQGRAREQLQNKGNIKNTEVKKQSTVTKQEEHVKLNESPKAKVVLPQNNKKVISNNTQQCQFNEIWPKVLARIKNERIALYAFLSANSEAYLEDNQLMIGFQPDCLFHKESLEKRENKDKVEAILKEETNIEIKLNCFVTTNSKKQDKKSKNYSNSKLEENKANRDDKNNIAHETIEGNTFDNEILEKARDLFGGNIFED